MDSRLEFPAMESLHRECFACGSANPQGLNLHFEIAGDGAATALWQPQSAFRSYPDRVHGGVLATLADSAIVHCLFARGVSGVTAELTLRYRHAVQLREAVVVRGWIESCRHGVYFCKAEILQSARVAVQAAARFMVLRQPRE
jgi:acyl-coenzyme A thioesterase PaaI-like protein